jgi:hypothetical protein
MCDSSFPRWIREKPIEFWVNSLFTPQRENNMKIKNILAPNAVKSTVIRVMPIWDWGIMKPARGI